MMSLVSRTVQQSQTTLARMVSSTAGAVEPTIVTLNPATIKNWDTVAQVDHLLSGCFS